jgi:hypothetical protein
MYLLVFCLFLIPAHAQFFKNHNTVEWLKPDTIPNPSDSSVIGNYPVLTLDQSQVQSLENIASETKGTLFLVLGTNDSLTNDPLFQIGRIKVFRQHVLLAGDSIPLEHDIAEKPRMVRLSYSLNKGNRFYPPTVIRDSNTFISECIFFKKLLKPQQIRRVETYLALKYSINITANSNPNLRSYVSGRGDKLWNNLSDSRFNTEVMALGRVDSLGWKQTQTYTVDGKSIQISLDSNSTSLNMPPVTLPNNSLLVLSKSAFAPESSPCGAAIGQRLWKIKVNGWVPSGGFFYITFDRTLDEMDYPVLTNGTHNRQLTVKTIGTRTQVKVPLMPHLASNQYYLLWGTAGILCQPLCQVNVNPCSIGGGPSSGSVQVDIAPEALPAQLEIYNLDTKQRTYSELSAPFVQIDQLNSGQYQLSIKNQDMQLADQLIVLEHCSDQGSFTDPTILNNENIPSLTNKPNNDLAGLSADAAGLQGTNAYPLTQRNLAKGILAYPNPAKEGSSVHFDFNGLDDQEFTVNVMDKQGKLLDSFAFTPTANNPSLQYDFKLPATYIVRFTSARYADHIQVVIN